MTEDDIRYATFVTDEAHKDCPQTSECLLSHPLFLRKDCSQVSLATSEVKSSIFVEFLRLNTVKLMYCKLPKRLQWASHMPGIM